MSEEKKVEQLTLYQKIHAIMSEIDKIEKTTQIKFNSTNYWATDETKVLEVVRPKLIEQKLIILPVEQIRCENGNKTTVDTTYEIIDTETGDKIRVVSGGSGVDTQDKGVGKAQTYAEKYLLLKVFLIPTGNDPDKTSSAELDEKMNKLANQKEKGQGWDDKVWFGKKHVDKTFGEVVTQDQRYIEWARDKCDVVNPEKMQLLLNEKLKRTGAVTEQQSLEIQDKVEKDLKEVVGNVFESPIEDEIPFQE